MKIEGENKMKEIDIKYDLANSARKVTLRDCFSKVFKVDKRNMVMKSLPIFLVLALAGFGSPMFVVGGLIVAGYAGIKNLKVKRSNEFKKSGAEELASIAAEIKDENKLNLNTNAKLLSLANEQNRIYNITLNDKKMPVLLQTKLINIPVYNRMGSVETVPVVQEHAIGSNVYRLSLTRR